MKKRLFASMIFAMMVMIAWAIIFNFAHNPEWFGNSIKYGVLCGGIFFLGTVLDKNL